MLEIPLKFKTEYLPNSNSPIVEIVGLIDVRMSQSFDESVHSEKIRSWVKKSMASFLHNKFFSELKHEIHKTRDEILSRQTVDWDQTNQLFDKILAAIPKFTP